MDIAVFEAECMVGLSGFAIMILSIGYGLNRFPIIMPALIGGIPAVFFG